MLLKVASVIALGILIMLAVINHGKAHEFYSPYCCSGKDCAPAKVSVNPDGSITATNKFGTARFDRKTFRPSQDSKWHACIHPTLGPRCLYIPGGV